MVSVASGAMRTIVARTSRNKICFSPSNWAMYCSTSVIAAINSFYVVLEVIENRLPALSLHIDRIFFFRIECGDHFGGIPFAPKLDVDLTSVRHNVSNVFKRLDGRISAFEIKPKTSIFSLHSALKLATYT